MNKVILMGRLTKDVEVRQTNSGTTVANFSLAVNRGYKREGGPDADFINCIAWSKTAETMEKYTSKGRQIVVEGRIETSNYEKDGQRIYKTDVVVEKFYFADGKQNDNQDSGAKKEEEWQSVDDQDEELPF
jgi:single-strand DNA-binding protein